LTIEIEMPLYNLGYPTVERHKLQTLWALVRAPTKRRLRKVRGKPEEREITVVE
jgi:hypothetical protein